MKGTKMAQSDVSRGIVKVDRHNCSIYIIGTVQLCCVFYSVRRCTRTVNVNRFKRDGNSMMQDKATILDAFANIIGSQYVLTDPSDTQLYQQDWRGRYQGAAVAVLMPGSTQEVAALVKECARHGVAIVPQGGNTGLVGGAIAPADRPAVLLNVSRMNRIRHVDADNNSLTVDAGCILANVRDVADEHQRQFPMLLGSV